MAVNTESIAARLRDVRVGIRPELEVSRHLFSGVPAYVVRDPITFQSHRIGGEDYQVFVAINSSETLGRTFERLCASGVTNADQEEEFYRYIISLNQRALLSLPVSDGSKLYARFAKRQQAKRKRGITSLLFLRVPLMQPDQFLARSLSWVAPLFSRMAFLVWSAMILLSIYVVYGRWDSFQSPLANVLTTQNLPLMWCLLVGLKVIHEFGHAYACKHFGGNVPEIGAYFILFTPCAYVDASASWGFENRWHRVIVALAGMYFESIAAMVALAIWCFTGPGLVHDAAHSAVVFSTLVTIGFNANPLMKYDGYYVMSDLLGMPNLRSEAFAQIRGTLVRVLYGVKRPQLAASVSRRWMLAAFGLLSSGYKIVVLIGIALVIAVQLPLVGISLAVYFIATTIWQSGQAWFRYLRFSDELYDRRRQAIFISAVVSVALLILTACLQLPASVESVGVVQQAEETVVRAGVEGFLAVPLVQDGERVVAGQCLCRLENDELAVARAEAAAESKQLQVLWRSLLQVDPAAAAANRKRWVQAQQRLQLAEAKYRELEVRSTAAGIVIDREPLSQFGSFIRRGSPLVTIGSGIWQVSVLLTAEQFAESQIRVGTPVQLRLTGRSGELVGGSVVRVGGGGSHVVADETFTQLAGGEIAVDALSMQTAEAMFEVRIELVDVSPELRSSFRRGMTAVVQFSGRKSSLAGHLYRRGLNLLNQLRVAG